MIKFSSTPTVITTLNSATAYTDSSTTAGIGNVVMRVGSVNRITETGFYFKRLGEPSNTGVGNPQFLAIGY